MYIMVCRERQLGSVRDEGLGERGGEREGKVGEWRGKGGWGIRKKR